MTKTKALVVKHADHIIDDQGLIFCVLGSHHPANKFRSQLVYVPVCFETLRKLGSVSYAKLGQVAAQLFLKSNCPSLLHTDPVSGEVFPAVEVSKIKEVFDTTRALRELLRNSSEYSDLSGFMEHLHHGGIAIQDIGLSGSVLLGFKSSTAGDYDLVIYGSSKFSQYQKVLDTLLQQNYRRLNEDEIYTIATTAGVQAASIDLSRIIEVVRNRFRFSLMNENKLFSVKFAWSPDEPAPETFIGPAISEVTIRGLIVDESLSHYCPYTYAMESNGRLYKVVTYSFLYISAALEGQEVLVQGTFRGSSENIITIDKHTDYIGPIPNT